MTDPVKPVNPAVPVTMTASPTAPSPPPAPVSVMSSSATKSSKVAKLVKKVDRIKFRNIIVEKGVATVYLSVEDAQGLTTTLPEIMVTSDKGIVTGTGKYVIPVWKASDPRLALTPSADGLKVSVASGSVDEEIEVVMISATVTLPDPDNRVLTADNTREPLSVRGTGTGTFEIKL